MLPTRSTEVLALPLAAAALVLSACTDEVPSPVAPAPVTAAVSDNSPVADYRQTNDLRRLPPIPGQAIVGSVTLKRDQNGVTAHLTVDTDMAGDGSIAGQAVTVWALVFNKPDLCSASCVPGPDFGSSMGDVIRLAGWVTGNSGAARISGRINVGDTSESIATGNGLIDPFGSEIHFVVRSHGPVQPGLVDEQMHTVGGGCVVNFPLESGQIPSEVGECGDVAGVAFGPAGGP